MSYLINGPVDIKDNSNTNQAKINFYNPAGTFYVSLISPPSLSSSFNFSFPTTPGVTGQYLSSTGAGTTWSNAVISSYSLPIMGTTMSTRGTANNNLFMELRTADTTFTRLALVTFPGLTSLGGSTSWSVYIEALVLTTVGSTFQARIVDLTNSLTIVTYTSSGLTLSNQLYNLGGLINLTLSPAVWEIQVRYNSGTNNIRIYSYRIFG